MEHERPAHTLLVVAAILINEKNEILLTQRPEGKSLAGLWEFPGGKIEPDESPEEALVRELKEEIGIKAQEEDLIPFYFASQATEKFHLLMPLYALRKWEGTVTSCENQQYHWSALEKMTELDVIPADIPLIHYMQKHLFHLLGKAS